MAGNGSTAAAAASVPNQALETDERLLQERYLNGLRRFKEQGVRVLIDGKEKPETDWGALFGVADDGGFYMADFIAAPEGAVKEIRFDRIYVRDLYA